MRRHPHCLNCGAATPGEFCGECGQRNADLHASFWELTKDLLGEAFEADSRMGRTVLPFLFKPGFLTNEHNAGRRVRYSSPLRLYLFCSFAFFLALSFTESARPEVGGEGGAFRIGYRVGDDQGAPDGGADGGTRAPGRDGGAAAGAGADGGEDDAAAPDAGQADGGRGAPDAGRSVHVRGLGPLNQRLEQRLREVSTMEAPRQAEFKHRFMTDFFANLPKVMFLLLPLFALLLKLLHWRSGRFYVEHLTFSLHVHAFAFLAFALVAALRLASGSGLPAAVPLAAALAVPLHVLVAARVVYREAWGWTLAKLSALAFAYTILLSAGIAAAALAGMLTA